MGRRRQTSSLTNRIIDLHHEIVERDKIMEANVEGNSRDNSSESRLLCERTRPIVALPIELLVYVFSFVTSARDKTKLRYVSQRLRSAVEAPSLWRDFTWPHFDIREEQSIKSVFKSCGGHVKRISFPDLVIPVKLFQYCSNVIQLSIPSANLSFNQLKTAMRFMKNLQYLDITWKSRKDVKRLLLICANLKELTISEEVKGASFHSVFLLLLLNEWGKLRLTPHILNIVSNDLSPVKDAIEQWVPSRPSSASHTSYLKVYRNFKVLIGLGPTFPSLQLLFIGQYCTIPYVVGSNYGLLGLDGDSLVLFNRTIGGGNVVHKAIVMGSGDIRTSPMNVNNIGFLTHFDASQRDFYSGHLEQLAIACPNLQQLSLFDNVNCLKSLQGLRAVASFCKNLAGLNIIGISASQVESCVQLWEILVDLQLSYLAIGLCCLLCFENDETKQIVTNLHQKCLKMKALESYLDHDCTYCTESKQLLELSNFPSLIHCITCNINIISIPEKLRYLKYAHGNMYASWPVANYNLDQLCIVSDQLALPDSFMSTISAHGGLVHVILSVNFVTQNGIAALIDNSPNLITCHVHIRTSAVWCILFNPRDFRSRLEKKYSQRKLFLCGSYQLVKGKICYLELRKLLRHHTVELASLWSYGI